MRKIKTSKGTEIETIDLKGKDYLTVQQRLIWFRDEHPSWRIQTLMIRFEQDFALFQAIISDEKGNVIATAHGSETKADFRDHIEKSETKAVGRALGYAGFGTQFMADELDEGERIVDAPVVVKKKVQHICSFCQADMKFNKKGNLYYCPSKKLASDEHSLINLTRKEGI